MGNIVQKQKNMFQAAAPLINREKCTDCGLCAELCLVYEKNDKKVIQVRPELCIKCGHCGAICPSGAIEGSSAATRRLTKKEIAKLPSPESLHLLFRSRRSVRRYKREPLKKEDLEKILEAGRYTPTGANNQGIKYLILNDPEKLAELRRMLLPIMDRLFSFALRIAKMPFAGKMMGENQAEDLRNHYAPAIKLLMKRNKDGDDRLFYRAPALMLVYGEKQDEALQFSCHIAMFNCSMMAHLLGIGCLLNSFTLMAINNSAKMKKYLCIPKTDKVFGAMTMGYQNIKYNALIERNPANVRYF
jgi:nitroreductase/Pyruvate/2-oxoacid:ferredoxin oxidoreductase delta subunit